MPQTACIELYNFSELSESAKEEAKQWYRENCLDYNWWNYVYEDFIQVANILGIEIKTRSYETTNNKTYQNPCIYFSGFWNQGDGACYEGYYKYNPGSVAAIKAYAPKDETLHKIAKNLYEFQKQHFYNIQANISHSGHYYNEYCMDITVEPIEEYCNFINEKAEKDIIDNFRQLAKWLYKQLKKEYDWLTSDEAVNNTLNSNDYSFYENGEYIDNKFLLCT